MENAATPPLGRRRGRPRSFDADAALARVQRHFWTQGFAASALDDLADAAGLNRPNLAAAFGDKQALYLAALAQYRAGLQAGMAATLAQPGPLAGRLHGFFTAAITLYTADAATPGCFILTTAAAEAARLPAIRQALADVLAEIDAALLACCIDAGCTAPAARAGMAAALLHSLAVRARAGADAASLHALAADGVRLLAA
jgi:AcrR family transcriptional regulator